MAIADSVSKTMNFSAALPMNKALICAALIGAMSPVASAQTNESVDPLVTRPGFEIGGQLSDYQFEEPTLGVKIDGLRAGVTGAYTYAHDGRWFFRLDGRYAYGSLDYEGSGTLNSIPDSIIETRAVLGKDFFPRSGLSLSPFVGFGYRYLYNDLRGTTSTGFSGYQRYSRYWYVPIGVTSRMKVDGGWVLAPIIEYDYFIKGRQVSQFSDIGVGFSDATNKQDEGYGYRLSLMAENGSWAFGPWMQYWNIEESDIVSIGFGFRGFEPKNETREFGLDVKYRF